MCDLILSFLIQRAFSLERAMVDKFFLLSMSLSSLISDPTFFTDRQVSSALLIFLSIHVYSVLSVLTLS